MSFSIELLLAVLLSLALAVIPGIPASEATAHGEKVGEQPSLAFHVLDNGLRVVILEDHASPVVAVNAWVHAGGKDEQEHLSGYSHYLEHLTSRGTKKRKPLQDRLDIFHVGGQNSANTYFDRTQYFNVVRKEHFDLALDGLADILQNAELPEEGIEAERQVVTEELRRFLDNPNTASYRETFRMAFGSHPYSRPVIGNFATLNGLRRDDFIGFYKAMYAPNNMVLAIVGAIPAAEVLLKVKDAFRDFKPNPALKPNSPHSSIPTGFRGYQDLTQRQPLKRASVTMAFVVPGWRHPDRWTLEVLARILGGGPSSRLWQSCVERDTLAADIGATNFTLEDLGLIYISATPKVPSDTFKLKASILRELKAAREVIVSPSELERVKRQARLLHLFGQEEMLNRAQDLGESALYGGIRYEIDWLTQFEKVNAQDVAQAAIRYLVEENLTTVQTLPEEVPGPDPKDQQACAELLAQFRGGSVKPDWLDFNRVAFTEAEANWIPQDALQSVQRAAGQSAIIKRTLNNGLTVLFKQRTGRPVVGIAVHSKAGAAMDPKGKEGLSELVSALLTKGAGDVSQEEIAKQLDELGGQYGIGVDRDLLYASLTTAKTDFERGLALLSKLFVQPRFEGVEFDKEKADLLSRIERKADDVGSVAGDLYSGAMFSESRYAHPTMGTHLGVKALSSRDPQNFHRQFIRPERTVLTVVGDLSPQEFETILGRNALSKWTQPPREADSTRDVPLPQLGLKTQTVEKHQSQIIVGAPAVARDHPDYIPLRVLTSLVGLRCFVDLVYNKPMAYSTGGSTSLLQTAGAVSLFIGVAADKTEKAVAELHQKWRQVYEKPVSEDELGHIKNRIIGGQALTDQRAASLAASYGAFEAYGLGYQFYDHQNEAIRAIKSQDLHRVAKRYLAPERLLTVIVGPKADSVLSGHGASPRTDPKNPKTPRP